MIVLLQHFLFFFCKWQIKIRVIKLQHGVSVQPPKHTYLNTHTHTHIYAHAAHFSCLTLPHPKSPVLCLRGVNVSGCWIVIFECSFWGGFRVNICRIGTVIQSINQSVILADRWSREDPWYHVQWHSELLFKGRTQRQNKWFVLTYGDVHELKYVHVTSIWMTDLLT